MKQADKQMTDKEYKEIASNIWQKYVPKSGQSSWVEGELIRSIEKLRDEAQRNGNGNVRASCHIKMVEYIRKVIGDSNIYDKKTKHTTEQYLSEISDFERPYIEDEAYNELTKRVVEWHIHHNGPVKREYDDTMDC